MLTLALIRHGETDWNREGRVMGWQPVAINATGRSQVARMAERLRATPLQAIYTSPLPRTAESAAILAAPHGLTPIPDERWIETKITGWEEKLWEELEGHPIRGRYYADPTTRLPDGETLTEVQLRTIKAVEELTKLFSDGIVVIVSHADPIRVIVSHYLGLPLSDSRRIRIEHASLTLVEIDNGVGALRLLNAPPELVRL
jgi:glucosyl-3-phosphoglycerate phosphatase